MGKIKQNKTRVSIILPEALFKEMNEKIEASGYGAHKVSFWVTEALDKLIATPGFPELVQIGDSMSQLKKTIFLTLKDDAYARLNNAVIDVRSQFPAIDGVKSRILRTAIIQRLLRE